MWWIYTYLEKQNVFASVPWIFNYCIYVEYKCRGNTVHNIKYLFRILSCQTRRRAHRNELFTAPYYMQLVTHGHMFGSIVVEA